MRGAIRVFHVYIGLHSMIRLCDYQDPLRGIRVLNRSRRRTSVGVLSCDGMCARGRAGIVACLGYL